MIASYLSVLFVFPVDFAVLAGAVIFVGVIAIVAVAVYDVAVVAAAAAVVDDNVAVVVLLLPLLTLHEEVCAVAVKASLS